MEDSQMVLDFANENILENPKTSRNNSILIMTFFILIILLSLFYDKKHIRTYIIISIFMLIPFTVDALCKFNLEINTKIIIEKNKTCFYDGELVQGAEYTNGQYTYRYMQEYNGNGNWSNMRSDGWGMMLTDKDSTDIVNTKMCTRINEKPITSMFATFYRSNASIIDVSSFDTSNVTNMRSMFIDSKSPEIIGLNKFNTSKVTSMRMMFRNSMFNSIDVSSFDTSNVTTMQSMFQGMKIEELNINHFNTQKVIDMQQMFYGLSFQELDISNLDLSSVTNVKSIFRDSLIKKVYVKDQTAFNKLNASSFKPSGLVIEIK